MKGHPHLYLHCDSCNLMGNITPAPPSTHPLPKKKTTSEESCMCRSGWRMWGGLRADHLTFERVINVGVTGEAGNWIVVGEPGERGRGICSASSSSSFPRIFRKMFMFSHKLLLTWTYSLNWLEESVGAPSSGLWVRTILCRFLHWKSELLMPPLLHGI